MSGKRGRERRHQQSAPKEDCGCEEVQTAKAKRRVGSGQYDTLTLTHPTPNRTANVVNDSGANNICVQGTNALDSSSVSYNQVGIGIYQTLGSIPSTFPGCGGTAPEIVCVSVTSGSFLVYDVPGAAANVGLPGATNYVAIWPQYSGLSWSNTPFTFKFLGHYATLTDCGTTKDEPAAEEECEEVDAELLFELPVPRQTAPVLVHNSVGYICVKGGNAFDPEGDDAQAVAARIFKPGVPVPIKPPLGDSLLRIVNVDDNAYFEFDTISTYLPGAESTKGVPGAKNILAAWPQYDDGSWGPPSVIFFYGRQCPAGTSQSATDEHRHDRSDHRADDEEAEGASRDGESELLRELE